MTATREADQLERRRRDAHIYVIEGERHSDEELVAFDVVVSGVGLIGRWVHTADRSWVTWTDGSEADTGPCDEPAEIVAAVRASAPIPAPPSE